MGYFTISLISPAQKITNVYNYMKENYAYATKEWIALQLPKHENTCGHYKDNVYRHFLEQDWSSPDVDMKNISEPSLPPSLDTTFFSCMKLTYNGKYLLQINAIHDISKPDNHEIVEEVDDAENDLDDDDDDDDDEDGNIDSKSLKRLFKLKKGKKDKKPKRPYGPRVFQLRLTDGHRECIAIEHKPIPFLHVNMVGYKILLSGPFDAHNGVIFLESYMIKLISDFVLEDTVHIDQMERND